MRGSVLQRCSCRGEDGKLLRGKCPRLSRRGHGLWWFRYDAPRVNGRRRQPIVGPFTTKKAAEEELSAQLGRLGGGGPAQDRSVTVAAYLDAWVAGKIDLKPSSLDAATSAVELYWKPALGHLRLVDLRGHHIAEAIAEMRLINGPADGQRTEMGRRLLAVRTLAPRARLAPGERAGPKSVKPLSPARIRRLTAVLRAALNAAVPSQISVNPCDGVPLPRVPRVRPLPWTAERESAWRAAVQRREVAAGKLASVQRQELWGAPSLRPSPVMVWMPAHTGAFLDAIGGERLYALFAMAAYCGMRRGELLGLTWAETDLGQGVAYVRETGTGEDPKSDAGVRPVPMPDEVTVPLRVWRKRQAADRLAWGPDWQDTGRAFTREDGSDVPPQWLSTRFATLAYRAGLPPVRFHDLRHGAASLCKAAGQDSKHISALLGHSRSSFTDDIYVLLFPEVAKAAADAAAAIVPRASKPQP